EIVRVFRELDPPSLEKVTDTAVTFNALERGVVLDDAGQDVLRALFAADIDYELFDVATGNMAKPLVFYGGGRWISPEEQQRLQAYVDGGGTVVCFQPPPNLLAVPEPAGVASAAAPQRLCLWLGDHQVELRSEA